MGQVLAQVASREVGKTEGYLNRLDELVANLTSQQLQIQEKVYKIAGYPLEKSTENDIMKKPEPNCVNDRLALIYENLATLSNKQNHLYEYLKENI